MSGKRRWDARGILIVPGDNFDCMDLDMGRNHVMGMVEEEEEETNKRMKMGGRESNGLTFPANVSVTRSSEQQQQQQMQDNCKGSDKEALFFYKFF
ncbi:hypothetical protein MLD38_012743 [Melastoma candidum]|uniref:Uncharacterized protein n=1 Tax=Melastoma candidum TaxID=119954 RepID=A0ACB9R7L4_9MYRT|nr:hypothetical protein MLD38_012743 [Melastoma candidum]